MADFNLHGTDRLSSLDLSKNNLRDEGIAELSKPLRCCKFLVSLNVSSNFISPKGFLHLSIALSRNESLCILNVSTQNGLNRNRLQKLGGQYMTSLLGTLIQVLNLNSTSLGDQGVNVIFENLAHRIENKEETHVEILEL